MLLNVEKLPFFVFSPIPVINLAIVNEIYSGMNAVASRPIEFTRRAIVAALLLPIKSDKAPKI